MTNIKIIVAFFFCAITYGQQIDTFITKAIIDSPSKTIDSLAGVTLVTPYEAAKNYYILGKCYAFLNQEEKALRYFIQSKKAFEALGEKDVSKQIALEAHMVISSQENYDNYGMSFLEEYGSYADSVNSSLYKAYAISEFAKNAYYLFDFEKRSNPKVLDSASSIFTKALLYANKTDNDLIKAKLYSNLGAIYTTKKEYDSARLFLDKAHFFIDRIKDDYQLFAYYSNYGNSYLLEHEYNDALKYFIKAKNVSIPYYRDKATRDMYAKITTVYDSLNNNTERRKYERLYRQLDERINDREQNVKIHETTVKYDVEKKDKKITALERALSSFNKHRITYSVLLFLVFLLALYSFVRWRKVDVKRKKIEEEKNNVETEHIKTIEQLEKVKQLVIEEHIVLKNKVKIHVSNLMYIKSEDHYLNFIPFEGKKQFIRGKISEILEELPPNFVKCHRSYIVNTNYIKTTSSKGIILTNNEQIPVSRNFKL